MYISFFKGTSGDVWVSGKSLHPTGLMHDTCSLVAMIS